MQGGGEPPLELRRSPFDGALPDLRRSEKHLRLRTGEVPRTVTRAWLTRLRAVATLEAPMTPGAEHRELPVREEAHHDGSWRLSLRRRGVGSRRAARLHVALPLLALPQGARVGVRDRRHVRRR